LKYYIFFGLNIIFVLTINNDFLLFVTKKEEGSSQVEEAVDFVEEKINVHKNALVDTKTSRSRRGAMTTTCSYCDQLISGARAIKCNRCTLHESINPWLHSGACSAKVNGWSEICKSCSLETPIDMTADDDNDPNPRNNVAKRQKIVYAPSSKVPQVII
jgi:hypothetical protein